MADSRTDVRWTSPLTERTKHLMESLKGAFPRAYAQYLQWQYKRAPILERIAPILASSRAPTFYDAEFDRLQRRYVKWWPEYGYDGHSTWARGCERALRLMVVPDLREPDLRVLEIGCGDGMTGHALAAYDPRRQVTLNDVEDWRDPRTSSMPFIGGNICTGLPVDDDSFDVVVSYNTFEHLENPAAALGEMIRLCKRGGYIYIEFGPLYCSPLGLHAFSFNMPYPQFLFSRALIEATVGELGVNDLGEDSRVLQWTNGWRVAAFRRIFARVDCEVVRMKEMLETRHLGIIVEFPGAFSGRELTPDDLTVGSIEVLMRKK